MCEEVGWVCEEVGGGVKRWEGCEEVGGVWEGWEEVGGVRRGGRGVGGVCRGGRGV